MTSAFSPSWRPSLPYDNTMQAPAYTSVSARQTFTRPDTNPIPTPPVAIKKKSDRVWPAGVRHYVQRCFDEKYSIPGITKADMESELKKIISEAADSDHLDVIDWDHLPLPQQAILAERNKFYTMPMPMPMATTNDQLSNLCVQDTDPFSNAITPSKKRKSSELTRDHGTESSIPPWRNTNKNSVFDEQSSYPDKRSRIELHGKSKPTALESRRRRFEGVNAPPSPYLRNNDESQAQDIDQGPIVGKCETLEKRYFRLTSAPNPDAVRPLHVLEKTLELLKKKWRKDNNYSYICDQFKSLRQDLTVQHIKSDFTVNVYEIHARIALEKGDLGEYNQCQTQLRGLYAQNLGGHPTEFKAYRILYFLHTCSRTDMNDVLADLTPAEKTAPAVKHALDARSSLALGNYHRFFKLYLETPNMGAYLLDMFVSRERLAALANMSKVYKPDVKLRFVTEELGFESDEEAARFVCDNGGQAFLEEKEGEVRLITGKSASLFESAKQEAFRGVAMKGQA